ncbi:MAG: molybdopterin molybdotransferase MoeA [candidate division Zixibacteria bacterium]|nr:molybdopterin molybdotransferase MoeA [candidate division Zixibacteria bacterium]
MIPLDKAIKLILEDASPLDIESIPVKHSFDRVLGKNIKSELGIPRYNKTAIDGYAVLASDLVSVRPNKHISLKLLGESKPGQIFDGTISKGESMKVTSGSRLPDGSDTVVKFEDVARTDAENLNVYAMVKQWKNVIRAGREVEPGENLMPQGRVLNAADVARIAEVGYSEIEVYKKPKVGTVFIDEHPPEESKEDDNSVTSLNQFLSSVITQNGADYEFIGACNHDVKEFSNLMPSNGDYDNIIVMASQSIEDYNYLKNAFREIKIDLGFWRVAIKPGKSVLYGKFNKIPVFGISGNHWTAAVIFSQLIKPILAFQSGLRDMHRLEVIARITKELRTNPAMTNIFKAIVRTDTNGFTATPLLDNFAGELTSLSLANGHIIIPPHTNSIRSGDKVRVEICGPIENSIEKKNGGGNKRKK